MPAKIDQNLLPPVIRESIDPDILNRAQSIEWSIDRDTGVNEHGYLDGSAEDHLSGQNLLPKTHGALHYGSGQQQRKSRKQVEWYDTLTSGRDSGLEVSPTSPSLGGGGGGADLSPLDDAVAPIGEFAASNKASSLGQMKRHPQGMSPFPIYKVNQEQLQGDVFFEVAPRAKPGERTVHYEKSTRVLNEHEMDALGLDPRVFAPGTQTAVDEQEVETVETSVMRGGARELEDIYNNTMRSDAGEYFDRQRARSLSPSGSRRPVDGESSGQKRTVVFGSCDEIDQHQQEYYPYRDAHQGKPLPGDNEYGTWGSRFDDQKQWKLCNGQWVRVAPPKPEPKPEKYMAERLKCKPPKRARAVIEPVRRVEPQGNETDDDDDDETDTDSDDDEPPAAVERVEPRRFRAAPVEPAVDDRRRQPASRIRRSPLEMDEPPVDLDALRDKYRPKVAAKEPADLDADANAASKQPYDGLTKPSPNDDDRDDDHDNDDATADPGTILLEPIRPPTPPPVVYKAEPVKPIYVEMRNPLKEPDCEEDKLMEDPNLMWMHMGPAQYGPPFGSMKRRKAREEEWIGPPCELCHKQIEERRCMLAENMKFHCWHFACSFCLKTLKPADFLIAEADKKCYCLNCHKREFPEISLVGLQLDKEE